MVADGVQVLDTKEIDAILDQAEAEEWAKLAFLGPSQKQFAERLFTQGWPTKGWHIFGLETPLSDIPKKIIESRDLTALILRGNDFRNKGAIEISSMKNLEFLDLNRNGIEDIGAVAIASLPKIVTLELGGNLIEDQGAAAISRCGTALSIDLFGNQIGHSGCIKLIDFWADPKFFPDYPLSSSSYNGPVRPRLGL